MKKRLFRWFIALAVILPCMIVAASAASGNVINSGSCGDNVTYTLWSDGELVIEGTGNIQYGRWTSYCSDIAKVTIADGVTGIEASAFRNCEKLIAVDIPGSVTYIGDFAFYDCRTLESVTISDGITSIGKNAFQACEKLTAVDIPNSVTYIGDSAFSSCRSLASVTLPDSLTVLGGGAFHLCMGLTEVRIPAGVQVIGAGPFSGCTNLTAITVDERNAFYRAMDGVLFTKNLNELVNYPAGKSGAQYTIPTRVTSIGDRAFQNSTLVSVSIPNGVVSVGEWAFINCHSMTEIAIPASVNYIGGGAFGVSRNLTTITVDENNPFYCAVDGVLFSKDMTQLFCYPYGKNRGHYAIPDGVLHVGEFAFFYVGALTGVTIPDSVTRIDENAFQATSLTVVELPAGVINIGSQAFYDCDELTNVIVPDSVMSIGSSAFRHCDSLTSVTVGKEVASIGINAFSDCGKLTRIEFVGDAPETVHASAFSNCDDLTIYYHEGTSGWPTVGTWQGRPLVMIEAPKDISPILGTFECAVVKTVTIGGQEYQLCRWRWTPKAK